VFEDGRVPIVIPAATDTTTLDPVIAIHIGKTLVYLFQFLLY